MQNISKSTWIIVIGILIALIFVFIFWLKPSATEPQSPNSSAEAFEQHDTGKLLPAAISDTQAQSFSSKSQQDTQINCQIKVDGSNRLIVNEQTKDCFEYFITQYGEKSLDQIKTDFIAYLKASYQEPVLSQLTDLWSRYLQYRQELGNLVAPSSNKDDAKYYREILANTQQLRKKLFSDYEIQGLFGTQDQYDQYTVNRMEVMDNKNLSATEKAEKLKALFEQLPEDWKANLQQLNQLEDLRKLTAEIKARHGSADELRQMRTNLVGAEATQRLEVLDTQRSDWKQRVSQYLTERDSIMKSSMSDTAKQSAVDQLRSQQFNQQQEQLRLHTFESIHDQGGQLPFAE